LDYYAQLYWQELGPEYLKDITGFSDGLAFVPLLDPSNPDGIKYGNDPGYQIEEALGVGVTSATMVLAAVSVVRSIADPPTEESDGATSLYLTRTIGKSTRNVGINLTPEEFGETLEEGGWAKEQRDGAITYTKDGAKYSVYLVSDSTKGPSANFTPAGASKYTLKLRLEGK
jgi:hypothetical protein